MGRRATERAPGASLLDRDGEIAQLDAVLDAAAGGSGRLVLVEAPAGLGKSALLAVLRDHAATAGFMVLHARGGELEREFGFGVARQLLRPIEETALPPSGVADTFEALHALYWRLVEQSEVRPLLLSVDDAHWADPASLRWLSFVARRLDGVPIVLACALRPLEPVEDESQVTSLVADAGALTVRLRPLGREPAAALLAQEFGVDPDAEFATACWDTTGGNPLFLRQLLIALADEGISPTAAEAERIRGIGPPGVLRQVQARLRGIGADATRLAEALAILGDGVDLGVAAAVAHLGAHEAGAIVTALVRAGILSADDRLALSFVHPIVRAAVYEGISPVEREALHVRAADVLRVGGADAERIAAQLLLTRPRGDRRTVEILREAARDARARGAAESAVRLLERARAEPPPPDDEGLVLYELGVARRPVSAVDAARDLAEALELLDDPDARARAAIELGDNGWVVESPKELFEVLVREASRAEEADEELRRRLEGTLLRVAIEEPSLRNSARERIERLRPGLSAATPGGRLVASVAAYHDARLGIDRAGTVGLARSVHQAARPDEIPVLTNAGAALTYADELTEAAEIYDGVLASARATGSVLDFALGSWQRGTLGRRRGDLETAEADLRQAVAALEQAELAESVPTPHALLAVVLVGRGQVDEAAALLASFSAPPLTLHRGALALARASLLLAAGELAAGVEGLYELGAGLDASGVLNPAVLAWRSLAVPPLLALGRRDEAARLAADELDYARAWGAPIGIGRALRSAALAGDDGELIDRLGESLRVLEATPAQLELAMSLTELGAALRRANHRSAGRELLERGFELADRAGARPLAERAHTELLATGARPRRSARSGVEALTPSERRVAEMAATGMRNREIAQALFVTLRTVEVHLSAAYRKLSIQSRAQLEEALLGDRPR